MDQMKNQAIGRGRGRGRGLKKLHESDTSARNSAVTELLSELMKESANEGNNVVKEEEKEVNLGASKQTTVLGIGAVVEPSGTEIFGCGKVIPDVGLTSQGTPLEHSPELVAISNVGEKVSQSFQEPMKEEENNVMKNEEPGTKVEEKTDCDPCKPSTSSELPEAPVDNVPKTNIKVAHEFRMDAILSSRPMRHFFCRVCGCPAGDECYCCYARGHPICKLCQEELDLDKCPCPVKYKGTICVCEARLHRYRSLFREFMFENTEVGCINHKNGCNFVGIWKDVKSHQETCEYEMKSNI